jgi:hypothetical protein
MKVLVPKVINFHNIMEQKIFFKYINAQLNIGVKDLKTVYLLLPEPQKLLPQVYKGKLIYRIKGSSKRISYATIKKGLIKKAFSIVETIPF